MEPISALLIRVLFVLLSSSFYLTFAGSAAAAPILLVDGSGQLTGALGVEVDGGLYDVSFAVGTCPGVFSGCDEQSDFTFSTLGQAQAASSALLNTVFVDDPAGMFDSDPSTTTGCDALQGLCTTWIPYLVAFTMGSPVDFLFAEAQNFVSDSSDSAAFNSIWPINSPPPADVVFAVFTPAQVTIPEPGGTVALFGLALAGLWQMRRR